jgi:NAD(P)H-nitrite reductase large subunit
MVIAAIGVVPNVEPFRGTPLHIEKGIVVNERTETNLPDIFAAGDVAEGVDSITGRPQLNATWLNAVRQGCIAGFNMAGKKISYLRNVRINITNLFGLPFASVGLIRGEGGHYQEVTLMDGNHYRKLVFEDNLLVGTVLIGNVIDVGVLTSFIERRELFPKLKEELQKDPYFRGLLSIRRRILCQH